MLCHKGLQKGQDFELFDNCDECKFSEEYKECKNIRTSCTYKVPYSKTLAFCFAQNLGKKPYKCSYCDYWHLSSY